jgi:hypothetical protein
MGSRRAFLVPHLLPWAGRKRANASSGSYGAAFSLLEAARLVWTKAYVPRPFAAPSALKGARGRTTTPTMASRHPVDRYDRNFVEGLAGAAGFEPANGGIKSRCLTTWRRPNPGAQAFKLRVPRCKPKKRFSPRLPAPASHAGRARRRVAGRSAPGAGDTSSPPPRRPRCRTHRRPASSCRSA